MSVRSRGAAALIALAAVVLLSTVVPPWAASGAAGSPTSTPPPTPVPPKNSPSPYPTALATPPPSTTPPSITAQAAVLEDASTGQVLYSVNATKRRAIASLTKIMTGLIAVRRGHLSASTTVSAGAAAQPGSDMDLEAGEVITVRNLLSGMLLSSANDAAYAIAEHEAGTASAFVARMNARARAMHLRHTHFASPSGLNDLGYSDALDLAALARAAERSPTFADVVATKVAEVPSPSGRVRILQNRNALLWLYRGADGVKTGFTGRAGWCLVASARRGDRSLVAVVLGSSSQDHSFFDAAALLNYGFLEFRSETPITVGQSLGRVRVDGLPVPAYALDTANVLVRRDLVRRVRIRLTASPGVALPVVAGQTVGTATILAGRRPAGSVAIAALTPVAAPRVPVKTTRTWISAYEDVWRLFGAIARSTVGTFL